MHEETPDHELLERATARIGSESISPAPEEAELRAGWLAFSQLVERADAPSAFDDQAFLAKFSQAVQRRPKAARGVWLTLAALAASALLCAAAVGYMSIWNGGAKRIAAPSGSEPGTVEKSNEPAAIAQGSLAPLDWDDALDERIWYVNESLFQLDANSPPSDQALESLGTQLEEFRREVDESSL